eukprot:GHRR01010997.1.p1 GENE.GHRR01010997.1~~GHRR01010997.1.p1  ORF type:complete len:525 (+),score=202.09 GHRR01010997.1:426-2000(+)
MHCSRDLRIFTCHFGTHAPLQPCTLATMQPLLLPYRRRLQLPCAVIPEQQEGTEPYDPGSQELLGSGSNPSSSSTSSSGRQSQRQQGSWGSNWAQRGINGRHAKKLVSLFDRSDKGTADGFAKEMASSSSNQATAAPSQADLQLEASVRQNVERAAQTLNDIITEALNEMLLEEASAYLAGQDEPDLQLSQAARNAVVKRLDWLDANFLAALNAYLATPGVQANSELAALLKAVRTEVLDLVATRLPPSVQVLNATLQHNNREKRHAVLQLALSGGDGAVPAGSLETLGAAAHQLVDDMEDQQVVADRALLARLVLVREELRMLAIGQAAEQQFWGQQVIQQQPSQPSADQTSTSGAATSTTAAHGKGFFAFHRSNLPARCAAFMKELLAVPERDRRLALLTKAFNEDWVGENMASAKDSGAPTTSEQQSRGLKDIGQLQPQSLDIVRPGRFFTTLFAMRQELEQQVESAGLDKSQQLIATLQLFEHIRSEALAALDRTQRLKETGDQAVADNNYDYEMDLLAP